MPTCVAIGCKNRFSNKLPGVTFHKFPKNEELRATWVRAVRRLNWTPTSSSMICSQHFEESDLDRSSCLIVRLKEKVVPSIFPGFPKYLQKVKHKRKHPFPRNSLPVKVTTKDSPQKSTVTPCIITSRELHPVLPSKSVVSGIPTIETQLRQKIEDSRKTIIKYRKKIAFLQELKEMQEKRIGNLKSLLKDVKKNDTELIESLDLDELSKDLINRQFCKAKNEIAPTFYGKELKLFAQTLYTISPKAYNYVRKALNLCLPHSSTVQKWNEYSNGKSTSQCEQT